VTGALSLEVKWPRREADHSPPSSAEVKECVELYLRSSYVFIARYLVKHMVMAMILVSYCRLPNFKDYSLKQSTVLSNFEQLKSPHLGLPKTLLPNPYTKKPRLQGQKTLVVR
jgi:hypothetical protein